MKLRQVSCGSLLGGLLLAAAFSGCGASGGARTGVGGQAGVGGSDATGGESSDQSSVLEVGGTTSEDTGPGGEETGGAQSGAGGNTASGKTVTGGARATGGRTGTGGAPRCNANVQSVGCTPGKMTQTGALNGQYGTLKSTIGNKEYFFQVNEWGSSAAQTMSYGGDYFFKMTKQQANNKTDDKPAGYPSVFIGANANHSTANSGLPKRVGDLKSVLTTWNWNDNGTSADTTNNAYNAAYDVWFSTNPNGEPSATSPSGGFLMVWYYAQECQPMSDPNIKTDAGRTIDGVPGCWDVWMGTNNGKPVISYKRQGIVKELGFDLNLFIKDALAHYPNYMNANWYLTNIFAGFEIWRGGVNLESTSFCAEVN